MRAELAAAEHGGNLAQIARRYGVRGDRLLDLSANVNPLGPPRSLLRELARAARDRDELTRYPNGEHGGLTQALAERHRIEPDAIVIANGASALLDAAVRVRRLSRCLVPQPAFSEDRRALEAAGTDVVPLWLKCDDGFALGAARALDAIRRKRCDACLITNPHNPSGVAATRDTIAEIASGIRERGGLAIIDEAFVDYVPDETILDGAARESDTIVVRSLTKFFAVPALRVGYAVCEPNLARRLRATLPAWPVSTGAARALRAALTDERFERRSLVANEREREWLANRLTKLGIAVFDASANFLLLQLPTNAPLASRLVETLVVRDGIVVRDCSTFRGLEGGRFIRVGIRRRRESRRFLAALYRRLAEA